MPKRTSLQVLPNRKLDPLANFHDTDHNSNSNSNNSTSWWEKNVKNKSRKYQFSCQQVALVFFASVAHQLRVVVFAAAANCSKSIYRNDCEKQKNGLNSASALVLRCLILSQVFLSQSKLIKPVLPQAAQLGIFFNFSHHFIEKHLLLRDLIKDTL